MKWITFFEIYCFLSSSFTGMSFFTFASLKHKTMFSSFKIFSGHGSLKNSYCLIVFLLRNEQCSAMEVTLSKKLAVWVREMLFFIDWVESNDALPDCMPSSNKKCKRKTFFVPLSFTLIIYLLYTTRQAADCRLQQSLVIASRCRCNINLLWSYRLVALG